MLGNHTDIQFAVNPDFSQVEADVPQVRSTSASRFLSGEAALLYEGGGLVPGRIVYFIPARLVYLLWAFQAAIVAEAQAS